MPEDILQEQIRYYRARAGEYDEWFYRKGRYDYGEALNRQWFDEAAIVMRSLHAIGPVERTLELACGTGIWTEQLLKVAGHITALDASPEVIAINRGKLNAPNVTYHQVDLFAWVPTETVDLVLFGFWLSHVPPEGLDTFLDKVSRALRPGGQAFIVDSRPKGIGTARDQVIDEQNPVMRRLLNDGSEYQIIKVFYQPDELQARLARHGLQADVRTTENFFIYAHGRKQ